MTLARRQLGASYWFSRAIVVGLFLAGCSHIGPGTVPRDRFDYNTAVSDSWKEQTLLNVVKLRYADMPLFMEVASIVSGYSLESSVNLAGTIFESGLNANNLSLGTASKYIDRPTITYAPITGSQFNKNFMTPVPPSAAVRYKDSWFWIADRDFTSKRTFAYLMLLFSLTETGGKEGLPLVTIPAG